MQYGYGAPRQEVQLLSEGWVQVTSARFVVGHQTYPLAGITSVAPFTVPKDASFAWFLAVGSSLGILASLGMMAVSVAVGFVFLLIAGAVLGFAIYEIKTKKAIHGVVICTSGMQVQALSSPDLQFVSRVVGSLNQALAMR